MNRHVRTGGSKPGETDMLSVIEERKKTIKQTAYLPEKIFFMPKR